MNRRDFLIAGTLAGLAGDARRIALRTIVSRQSTADVVLRIGLIVSGTAQESTRRGAQLGIEEATRAGTLFNAHFELHERAEYQQLINTDHVHVILANASSCEMLTSSHAADASKLLLLNIGCTDDTLRTAQCRSHVLHIAASDSMLRSAAVSAAERTGNGKTTTALWHSSLERFGAAQLNDRYRARFGSPMDGDAWAAWFAIKLTSETTLRTNSVDPGTLAAYMLRPTVRFDGHKGEALVFDATTHQLRQPLYVVAGSDGENPRVIECASSEVMSMEKAGGCSAGQR